LNLKDTVMPMTLGKHHIVAARLCQACIVGRDLRNGGLP
jgi:hypothetical protein